MQLQWKVTDVFKLQMDVNESFFWVGCFQLIDPVHKSVKNDLFSNRTDLDLNDPEIKMGNSNPVA